MTKSHSIDCVRSVTRMLVDSQRGEMGGVELSRGQNTMRFFFVWCGDKSAVRFLPNVTSLSGGGFIEDVLNFPAIYTTV